MSKLVGVYGNGSDLSGIDQSVSGSDSFNSDIYARGSGASGTGT